MTDYIFFIRRGNTFVCASVLRTASYIWRRHFGDINLLNSIIITVLAFQARYAIPNYYILFWTIYWMSVLKNTDFCIFGLKYVVHNIENIFLNITIKKSYAQLRVTKKLNCLVKIRNFTWTVRLFVKKFLASNYNNFYPNKRDQEYRTLAILRKNKIKFS